VVKPAPFAYVRPASVADAVRQLSENAGSARVLAGGQSLVPMLHMRLMRPEVLVDINSLGGELGGIEPRGSETVIGALVRYTELETSPVLAERLPLLPRVVRHVGDRQVRNRGTIGGALVQADPTGEIPLACLALGAQVVARSAAGERTIPIEEFFDGSYASALEPEEMLVSVRLPLSPQHCAFFERGRKHNDFALLSMAIVANRDGDGSWRSVRIALGGVNDRPVLASAAAERLEGRAWDVGDVEEAVRLALDVVDPPDDVRASAEYRRHLVPIHLGRLLRELGGEA